MESERSEISELKKYKKLFEKSEQSRKELDIALKQSERALREAEPISQPTTIPEFLAEYHAIYVANSVEAN